MTKPALCITCPPEDLDQGLFGNVFTHPFQILPYLYEREIYPAWELRAKLYGERPESVVIPGALDLSYDPPAGPYRSVSLNELRRRHGQVLGGDWPELARIWKAYFQFPQRVLDRATGVLPPGRVLGIHYRGTDKQTVAWDSNPISQSQYLTLIQDYLARNVSFDSIFVASDEPSFADQVRATLALPVLHLGAGEHHMATEPTSSRREKTDRAMIDCVLLSKCDTVIQTSSALPSFAKLLNPELKIFRCAASRLFSNMPYFPVAYIPVFPVKSPESEDILRTTMDGDWQTHPATVKFRKTFSFSPRWPRNHKLFSLAARTGAENLVAKWVTGYK